MVCSVGLLLMGLGLCWVCSRGSCVVLMYLLLGVAMATRGVKWKALLPLRATGQDQALAGDEEGGGGGGAAPAHGQPGARGVDVERAAEEDYFRETSDDDSDGGAGAPEAMPTQEPPRAPAAHHPAPADDGAVALPPLGGRKGWLADYDEDEDDTLPLRGECRYGRGVRGVPGLGCGGIGARGLPRAGIHRAQRWHAPHTAPLAVLQPHPGSRHSQAQPSAPGRRRRRQASAPRHRELAYKGRRLSTRARMRTRVSWTPLCVAHGGFAAPASVPRNLTVMTAAACTTGAVLSLFAAPAALFL